jgi:RNA recognition motif-containing protein
MFKVEIQNLPKDMTWQELKRLGGDYGKSVEYARVVSERDSALGFLEFGDRKDALHFIESLNGKRMEDSDRRLRVAWDDSDDERKPSRRASPSPVARRRH